jgi:hypothetical protein
MPPLRHLPLAMALTFLLSSRTFDVLDSLAVWLAR